MVAGVNLYGQVRMMGLPLEMGGNTKFSAEVMQNDAKCLGLRLVLDAVDMSPTVG